MNVRKRDILIECVRPEGIEIQLSWNYHRPRWRILESGAAITREILISLREESVPYTAQRVAANRFL